MSRHCIRHILRQEVYVIFDNVQTLSLILQISLYKISIKGKHHLKKTHTHTQSKNPQTNLTKNIIQMKTNVKKEINKYKEHNTNVTKNTKD